MVVEVIPQKFRPTTNTKQNNLMHHELQHTLCAVLLQMQQIVLLSATTTPHTSRVATVQ
jgi:hypothetical protein